MREYYDKDPTALSKIPDNAFTKNLKDLMEERKLSDTQLADAIGVSRMTVGRYKVHMPLKLRSQIGEIEH